MSTSPRGAAGVMRDAGKTAGMATGVAVLAAITGWLVGGAISSLSGNQNEKWILARSAGITAYALLVALVLVGLILAHPRRAQIRWPSPTTRIRLHIGLTAFTLVFTVLHIVVLAMDSYAGVGWKGALLPLGSVYRPMPVTLGLLGFYSGLAAGLTALVSSRITFRAWLPIHRVAIVSLVLIWTHGLLAGSDTPALLFMYLISGAVVVGVAVRLRAAENVRGIVD